MKVKEYFNQTDTYETFEIKIWYKAHIYLVLRIFNATFGLYLEYLLHLLCRETLETFFSKKILLESHNIILINREILYNWWFYGQHSIKI